MRHRIPGDCELDAKHLCRPEDGSRKGYEIGSRHLDARPFAGLVISGLGFRRGSLDLDGVGCVGSQGGNHSPELCRGLESAAVKFVIILPCVIDCRPGDGEAVRVDITVRKHRSVKNRNSRRCHLDFRPVACDEQVKLVFRGGGLDLERVFCGMRKACGGEAGRTCLDLGAVIDLADIFAGIPDFIPRDGEFTGRTVCD